MGTCACLHSHAVVEPSKVRTHDHNHEGPFSSPSTTHSHPVRRSYDHHQSHTRNPFHGSPQTPPIQPFEAPIDLFSPDAIPLSHHQPQPSPSTSTSTSAEEIRRKKMRRLFKSTRRWSESGSGEPPPGGSHSGGGAGQFECPQESLSSRSKGDGNGEHDALDDDDDETSSSSQSSGGDGDVDVDDDVDDLLWEEEEDVGISLSVESASPNPNTNPKSNPTTTTATTAISPTRWKSGRSGTRTRNGHGQGHGRTATAAVAAVAPFDSPLALPRHHLSSTSSRKPRHRDRRSMGSGSGAVGMGMGMGMGMGVGLGMGMGMGMGMGVGIGGIGSGGGGGGGVCCSVAPEYTIGLDLDSGASKGVGAYYMNKVRILSGAFRNMAASGLDLSFYRKREALENEAKSRLEQKKTRNTVESSELNPLRVLGRSENHILMRNFAGELLPPELNVIDDPENHKLYGSVVLVADGDSFSPVEILKETIRSLRKDAEKYLRKKVRKAVVIVPSELNSTQRKALSWACRKGGVRLIRVVTGSVACGMAHCHKRISEISRQKNLLIYNHSSSGVNAAILRLQHGIVEVLAHAGTSAYAGASAVFLLARHILGRIHDRFGEEASARLNEQQKSNLRKKAADVLKSFEVEILGSGSVLVADSNLDDAGVVDPTMSEERAFSLSLEGILPEESVFTTIITSNDVEDACGPIWDGGLDVVKSVVQMACHPEDEATDAGEGDPWMADRPEISVSEIDQIALVGSFSRQAGIQKRLAEELVAPMASFDDSLVVYGATLLGAMAQGDLSRSLFLSDTLAFPIGLELATGEYFEVFRRNQSLPSKSKIRVHLERRLGGVSIKLVEMDGIGKGMHDLASVQNFVGSPLRSLDDSPPEESQGVLLTVIVKVSEKNSFDVTVLAHERTFVGSRERFDEDGVSLQRMRGCHRVAHALPFAGWGETEMD